MDDGYLNISDEKKGNDVQTFAFQVDDDTYVKG